MGRHHAIRTPGKARLANHSPPIIISSEEPRLALRGGCGCSSGVEHNLAKVGVGGSNPLARSKNINGSWPMAASTARWSAQRHLFAPLRRNDHNGAPMHSLVGQDALQSNFLWP